MLTAADRKNIALNLWVARIIPLVLAGIVGYATYVVVVVLSVKYLLGKHDNSTAAVPILVFYFLLLILMACAFFRLIYVTFHHPPFVPLGPAAARDRVRDSKSRKERRVGIGRGEYNQENATVVADARSEPAGVDADAPGLEQFYSRDVFICEMDGKPKWCSTCGNWKPDRVHHCSSSGRCIHKMDHFCPWVGGPIGLNNFKFFLQFTGWTALFCTHIIVVMAVYIRKQRLNPDERVNSHFIATLVLSSVFGAFTAGMTGTSIDLTVRNQTQVERLGIKSRIHILAVKKPDHLYPLQSDRTEPRISYPEITYPLDQGQPPPADRWQPSDHVPIAKANVHTKIPQVSPIPQTTASDIHVLTNPPPVPPKDRPEQDFTNSSPPSRDLSNRSEATAVSSTPTVQMLQAPHQVSASSNPQNWPTADIALRDLSATRTFAVLKMNEPGSNPWDLGSARKNWESVMGTSWLDWLLPLRRSPCEKHESLESYYEVGPDVDELKRSVGFLPPLEGGESRRRRRQGKESESIEDRKDRDSTNRSSEGASEHRRKKRRKRHSEKSERTGVSGSVIA